PRPGQRPCERLAVPAFDDLRSGYTQSEPETTAGQVVQSQRLHRAGRGSPGRQLCHGRAEPDPARRRSPPRQRRERVRSPGLGRVATGLRDRRIEGVRGSDGRVHVPPVEYDPVTAEPLHEFVEVATEGTVLTWSWIPEPLAGQPFQHSFAWALVKLDGADTAM